MTSASTSPMVTALSPTAPTPGSAVVPVPSSNAGHALVLCVSVYVFVVFVRSCMSHVLQYLCISVQH